MTMKKIICIIIINLAVLSLKAQDIHFSMFHFSPLNINPANCGVENDLRVALNYRNQWRSVANPYSTIAGSYDMRLSKSKSGIFAMGINFYNDRAGDSKMGITQANLAAAYHLILNREQTIGLGINTGFAQRSLTGGSALMWGNQYDGTNYNPALPTGEPFGNSFSTSYLDAAAGIIYSYRQEEKYITGNDHFAANVGFSVSHVHQPNISFYGAKELLYRKYIFHTNAIIGVPNSRVSFTPGIMYALQGPARELLFGTALRYRLQEDAKYTGFITGAAMSLGIWYRNRDAVSLTTLLQWGGYSIGFAYDINISDLSKASSGRGGFELHGRYVLPNPQSIRKSGSTRFL